VQDRLFESDFDKLIKLQKKDDWKDCIWLKICLSKNNNKISRIIYTISRWNGFRRIGA
jgi:hypothetical protein